MRNKKALHPSKTIQTKINCKLKVGEQEENVNVY